MSTKKKIAIGVGIAVVAAIAGFAAYKILSGRKVGKLSKVGQASVKNLNGKKIKMSNIKAGKVAKWDSLRDSPNKAKYVHFKDSGITTKAKNVERTNAWLKSHGVTSSQDRAYQQIHTHFSDQSTRFNSNARTNFKKKYGADITKMTESEINDLSLKRVYEQDASIDKHFNMWKKRHGIK